MRHSLLLMLSLTGCWADRREPSGELVYRCDVVEVCNGSSVGRGMEYRSVTARNSIEAALEYRLRLLSESCVERKLADAKCWFADEYTPYDPLHPEDR